MSLNPIPGGAGKARLLVFAKYPRPGGVKTRLTPPFTHEEGADLYGAFLLDSLESWLALPSEIEITVLAADPSEIEPMRALLREEFGENIVGDDSVGSSLTPRLTVRTQRGAGLEERLTNAFDEAFAEGAESACAVGTDNPTLPIDHVSAAFDLVERGGLVLGPAEDGGYYLIGMRSPHPEVFRDIPFSTSEVAELTRERARDAGLEVVELPLWYDVDDAPSVARLRAERDMHPLGRRTSAAVERALLRLEAAGGTANPSVIVSQDDPLERAGRIGIFGGTFDPVHAAHLLLAERAREELGLDVVLFIPANIPPHKTQGRRIASAAHRLAMLRLAVASNPGFAVSEHEIEREGVSYTVDTLEYLHGRYPAAGLVLLIGGDNARDFGTWREPERIARLASIAVWARPEAEHGSEILPGVPLFRIDAPLFDLSSTDIRGRVGRGSSIRYMTPDPVADYIAKHEIYI